MGLSPSGWAGILPALYQYQPSSMTESNIAANPLTPEQRKQKERAKAREAAKAAMALLCEHYPEIFNLNEPKPLKIGIHQDLAADEKISKTKIRRGLSAYVRHHKYHACLIPGANRVGIDGQVTGQVTEDEASHAQEKLSAQKERFQQRKKQNQQRRRDKEKSERINQKLEALMAVKGRPEQR